MENQEDYNPLLLSSDTSKTDEKQDVFSDLSNTSLLNDIQVNESWLQKVKSFWNKCNILPYIKIRSIGGKASDDYSDVGGVKSGKEIGIKIKF